MRLQESFNSRNNTPIYYVDGQTYAIKDKLKSLGFSWYGVDKMWWIYKSNLNPNALSKLSDWGVDISPVDASRQIPSEKSTPMSNTVNAEPKIETPKEKTPELTNKTDRDNHDTHNYDALKHDWYGFNIKRNIYTTNFNVNVDGQEIQLKAVLDRWFEKGIRHIPIYKFNIFLGDSLIRAFSKTPNGALGDESPKGTDGKIDVKSCKRWGTYNEDDIAIRIPKLAQSLVDEKGKTYQALQNALKIDARDDDFKDFLKRWSEVYGEKEEYEFAKNNSIIVNVQIDEPGYEGSYEIIPRSVGGGVHFNSHVDHPLAPHYAILGSDNIPSGVQNMQQFIEWLNNSVQTNQSEIKSRYIKYLKSFPFKKEEEETSRADMSEVAALIGKQYNPRFFIPKLIEMGYVRLSKRQKREDTAPGFVPESEASKNQWVVESKKIVDDIYRFKRDPKQFYAVIAYYLHRKVRRISSWTDMMLTDAIYHWSEIAKQYGVPINNNEISTYFEQVTNAIFEDLFGRTAPRGVADEYANFYSNFFGGGAGSRSQSPNINNQRNSNISPFVKFVVGLGANQQEAEQNPKKVFKDLIRQYHSDKVGNDPQKTQIAIELIKLYKSLPQEVRASNWYKEIKFS